MMREKTISALVERQLPDFVRADNPQFKRFVELYYEWCEDATKGNTVYHIMNSEKYRDIDETLDPFIRLFKQELLPYFPETSELDLSNPEGCERILYKERFGRFGQVAVSSPVRRRSRNLLSEAANPDRIGRKVETPTGIPAYSFVGCQPFH